MRILTQSELRNWSLVGTRTSIASGQDDPEPNAATSVLDETDQTELLRAGIYESGNLSVIVERGQAAVTYSGEGCIGSFDGQLVKRDNGLFIDGDDCSIAVNVLGPFDFSLEQGPGCSDYHGAACSLSGYVRRTQ